MKIIWSPQARKDILSLFSYVAEDDSLAAKKLLNTILSKIELLSNTPHVGRPGRVPGTRELIIDDTQYIIPYRCKDDRLEIIRIYHSSRKWHSSRKLPSKFD